METQLNQLLNMSSPVLIALVINLVIAALKRIPTYPDNILPLTAMALGAVGYPMLEGFTARTVVLGLAVGGMSVALNQQLRQWMGGSGTSKPSVPLVLLMGSLIVFGTGCARFHTAQTDQSYDEETGNPIRKITTRASTTTFFDSKSALSSFRASQTDKTQSATVGSLSQESSGTNVVSLIESVAKGAAEGAAKALLPAPVKK